MKCKLEFKKTFMRTCIIASLAAAVFPATALTYGEARWFDNLFKEDDPSSKFEYTKEQGSAKTNWEWRFQKVYRASKSCPKTSKTDCKVTFSYSPGAIQVPERIVFNVGQYDEDSIIIHRDTHLKGRYLTINPVFNRSFTLKPGQYAYPAVIHLDKYVPNGYLTDNWRFEGEQRLGFNILTGIYPEYKKTWRTGRVGTWDGHVFAKTQQMVCITNSGIPPVDNGGVNSICINKIPEIAVGAAPSPAP